MKIIKNINVQVTYNVNFLNIKVSDDIYEALIDCEMKELDCNDVNLTKLEEKAQEWLSDNIHESDAYNWSFEIDDIDV